MITVRKCADRVRYFNADCRAVNREIGGGAADDREPWLDAIGREPTPEHAAVMAETVEQLLAGFDESDRPVIELSLQGYSAQGVSEQLGRAERTVRRLRERFKNQLERLNDEQAAS